jgi:DNA polymerase I-like protein with 3'-5' exonuclease and polymerase domains
MKIVPKDCVLDKSNPELAKLRGAVKTMCLGIQYGMGAKSLQGRVPEDLHLDAKDILKNFEEGFPDVTSKKSRFKYIIESLHNDEEATFIFPDGFIYTVKDPSMHRTKSILSIMNMPIQGAGSCILRRIVDKLNETDIELAATIHDEIFFKIHKDSDIDVAADIMKTSFWEITNKDYIKIGEPEIVDSEHAVYHGNKAKEEFEKLRHNIDVVMEQESSE